MVMDDLQNFCCQNKECSEHGVRGGENIRVRSRYGPNKTRLLYCLVCKKSFSELRGTVFFDSRLPKDQVVSILEHVVEGNGMRKTSRLKKVHLQTVIRYTRLAGKHAEKLHDELVAFSPEHPGGSARRKMGLRSKKGKKLRRKQSG
jgi:transposase-like protein